MVRSLSPLFPSQPNPFHSFLIAPSDTKPLFTGDDFEILGFPCNQFGGQEPGSDEEIQSFCQLNYGVSFPIMGKTDVNGDKANPLFEWLKEEKPGIMGLKRVKWNFEKWLIGKDGKVKGRWASTTKPESLEKSIEAELGTATAAATTGEAKGEVKAD